MINGNEKAEMDALINSDRVLDRTVSIRQLIEYAAKFIEEPGTNDEYERAMAELIMDAARLPGESKPSIHEAIARESEKYYSRFRVKGN